MELTISFQIFDERAIKVIYLYTPSVLIVAQNNILPLNITGYQVFPVIQPSNRIGKVHYFNINSGCEDEDNRPGRGLLY